MLLGQNCGATRHEPSGHTNELEEQVNAYDGYDGHSTID
jgi:hypothetical protein